MSDPRRLPIVQPGGQPGAPPIFEKIGIVGVGLIGGSIALAARQIWPAGLVVGVDRNDVLERAMALHAVDVAADDLTVLSAVDLLILAAPVRENLKLLEEIPAYVSTAAVVTDTGSTKRAIVDAARNLPPRFTFIGGHPLGGAAAGGIDHARPDLFAGRPWLFTPESRMPPEPFERLRTFVSALGATPRTLGAAEHDHLLAYLSHLPQMAAISLMRVIGEEAGTEGLALAGRGLIDTTRLASSPGGIWRDVCATNADEIGRALDALIDRLREIRRELEAGDRIEQIFDSANSWRDALKNAAGKSSI